MARNGGTISYSPTFGYELCVRRADAAPSLPDLSGWRAAGVGGDMVRAGPLNGFARRFAEAGFRAEAFVPSYGMAEATLALTFAPLDRGLVEDVVDVDAMERNATVRAPAAGGRTRSFVRCGPILPGHELQVRGDDGRPLGERAVGRIFVRGPSLMREYFRQPEATAAVLSADGWLDTGDLGYLADGEITPTGRSKDLILLNGRNVWPQDLEWTAEAGVEGLRSGDVAAFNSSDDEQVVLLVQCRSSDREVRTRISEDVTALMRARHGVDAQVRLVGPHALPQTSSGKLSRSKARALFESGAFELVDS
jgi:fatty-acyl-CoA synthase